MQSSHQNHSPFWVIFGSVVMVLLSSCYPELPPGGNHPAVSQSTAGTGGALGDEAGTAEPDAGPHVYTGTCVPASAQPLPLRSEVLSETAPPTSVEVDVQEIFTQFKVQCGSCHVDTNLGGLQVNSTSFLTVLQDPMILQRIETTDVSMSMPQPTNITFAQRPAGDAVHRLDQLLHEWGAVGYPPDVFYEKVTPSADQNQYALGEDLGNALTNIGTCVPTGDYPFATDRTTMSDLDQKFAARKMADPAGDAAPEDKLGLPLELSDTDLTSFDSDVLAKTGVIAFAPAYPLWSDDSGKIRFVRVPLGQSIVFNPDTQQFKIPDNTRFYKTFLKEVVDESGKLRWKKIETRLIVARADRVDTSGNHTHRSLFGTYEWDEAETHATLLVDTLRNGDPFTDHLFEYETDEPAADIVRAKKPANLTYELEYAKLLRHYAVPGSNRCIHCHEGAETGSFVIGFTPLQINRRPEGQGGVYEAAGPDELTQLQRFIDLGVITGLSSPADVLKLEDSEGDRKPRNQYELKAQAYMMANCSHCHNPNGFPSVASPVLKPLLNFYPGKDSGIFQFPLERFSPRITRGYDNSPIAYITPSLRDIIPQSGVQDYVDKFEETESDDPNVAIGLKFLNVPWRSLIYRNVQTAFTYADSLTLYPHMPFDTGGHDCRASQWLGAWMVSIPAVLKDKTLDENFIGGLESAIYQDTQPQPYVEVLPGQDGYDAAVAAANTRLNTYLKDPEYSQCPDNSDIVDPDVLAGRYPAPRDTSGDGVPDRSNWVVTDLTDPKGLWEPRRTDWQAILAPVPPAAPAFPKPGASDPGGVELAKQEVVVSQLGNAHLSDLAGFADTPFPLALWEQKSGCKFDSSVVDGDGQTIRKASSFSGASRPQWFDGDDPAPPDAPVFSVLPGQAVFDMICINCHGPNADAQGRQADTLQNLTGGVARVANFRLGLFDPAPHDDPYDKPDLGPQTNRQRVFGPVVTGSVNVDDWGARYLAWMALGGTGIQIPQIILDQVARTDVAGVTRKPAFTDEVSANMLQVAQLACRQVLAQGLPFKLDSRRPSRANSSLIVANGDAELWTQLCSFHNAGRVHKISITKQPFQVTVSPGFFPATTCDKNGQPAQCYPANATVGDDRGNLILGLQPGNAFPWCIDPALSSDYTLSELQTALAPYAFGGTPLPICPAVWASAPENLDAETMWENRGAINAGFSVFEFLDEFIRGNVKHIGYDQCELLASP
jgi:hypothetical protein